MYLATVWIISRLRSRRKNDTAPVLFFSSTWLESNQQKLSRLNTVYKAHCFQICFIQCSWFTLSFSGSFHLKDPSMNKSKITGEDICYTKIIPQSASIEKKCIVNCYIDLLK